jgi:hypothetical protein
VLLHNAIARGCENASLRATPMAEQLYAAMGLDRRERIEFARLLEKLALCLGDRAPRHAR